MIPAGGRLSGVVLGGGAAPEKDFLFESLELNQMCQDSCSKRFPAKWSIEGRYYSHDSLRVDLERTYNESANVAAHSITYTAYTVHTSLHIQYTQHYIYSIHSTHNITYTLHTALHIQHTQYTQHYIHSIHNIEYKGLFFARMSYKPSIISQLLVIYPFTHQSLQAAHAASAQIHTTSHTKRIEMRDVRTRCCF